MIEELKIITEAFKDASFYALIAYMGYLLHSLAKIAIIVFPIIGGFKFFVSKAFKEDDSEKKDETKES